MSQRYVTVRLTTTEVQEIEELVKARQEEGSYYGNRTHYEKRLKRIVAALSEAWKRARCLMSNPDPLNPDTVLRTAIKAAPLSLAEHYMLRLRRCLEFVCMCGDTFSSVEEFSLHVDLVHDDDALGPWTPKGGETR